MKWTIIGFVYTLFILSGMTGCMTTKILTPEEASSYQDVNVKRKNYLILYNQNNQYELHNYKFQNDTLTGDLYVSKIDRSTGLIVFTDNDFAITDQTVGSLTRIPVNRIKEVQAVKTDIVKSVFFIAGVALITFTLWQAGNLIQKGLIW
jgi:hypothetical protein